jgi:hypothetical protein
VFLDFFGELFLRLFELRVLALSVLVPLVGALPGFCELALRFYQSEDQIC